MKKGTKLTNLNVIHCESEEKKVRQLPRYVDFAHFSQIFSEIVIGGWFEMNLSRLTHFSRQLDRRSSSP